MGEALGPSGFAGKNVYLVGIKGTGMAALAELLSHWGADVKGSDTAEKFYTDAILADLGIPYKEGFHKDNLPETVDYVFHSSAYSRANHPELVEAARRDLPILEYSEALGLISRETDASGIAGTHGKTTTTALVGSLVKALKLPATVILGSAAKDLGNRSTYVGGRDFFVAETCEYRRHFLSFSPRRLLITNIEADHLDYYRDYEDFLRAFIQYAEKLPSRGELIYCHDDKGARELVSHLKKSRFDIRFIPYGKSASGDFRLLEVKNETERTLFRLQGFSSQFVLRVPGNHTVLNATGALALAVSLLKEQGLRISAPLLKQIQSGLERFAGSSRRSEILGEAGGILFMDDYAHHPTEIETTLKGLRSFFPHRRIVLDFMSHTYTRTNALMEELSHVFGAADLVILHKVYASAREQLPEAEPGRELFERVRRNHSTVNYFHEVMDTFGYCQGMLGPGDLFLTMGAGDNWKLGYALYEHFSRKADQEQQL